MKKLGIVLVAVVGLLVVADVAARLVAEQALATQLQRSLGLPGKPSVAVSGEPFLWYLFKGDLPELNVQATDFEQGDIAFASIQVSLHDVRFSFGGLMSGSVGTVRAAGGTGTAVMTGPDLERALRAAGLDVHVRPIGGDRVEASGGQLPGTVQARLKVHDGILELDPVASLPVPSITVHLPMVVDGLRYTDVHIDGGRAVLAVRLDHPSLTL